MRILLVAEGSGGHIIPALEAARALARAGAQVSVWYAARPQTEQLVRALTASLDEATIDVEPFPASGGEHLLGRLWWGAQLWRQAQARFKTARPHVVVGFGGWISVPVLLAARQRGIRSLLHEQNVVMGRANRWLSPRVDCTTISFQETQRQLGGVPSVTTGMPIRSAIGSALRLSAGQPFGLQSDRPTLLILGGSQGAGAINRLMVDVASLLSEEERRTWQVLHLTGPGREAHVERAYAAAGMRAWVAPWCSEMETVYAHADLVIARAGASTIAELARCGMPVVLIPYPFAGGHQRANAQLVQSVGGGLLIDEAEATPARVLGAIRRILRDDRLRAMMATQMRTLDVPDAAQRLADTILELGSRAEVDRGARPRVAQAMRESYDGAAVHHTTAASNGSSTRDVPALTMIGDFHGD